MKKRTVYLLSIAIILLCLANVFLLVWNLRGRELFGGTHGKSEDSQCVNVLIVGDSIGAGDCIDNAQAKWDLQLQEWLESEYHVTCRMTNVSMGGNSSYAGYGRVAALQDGVDYDLAILCYGQNDAPDSFQENYESIIVALRDKYPGIKLISILESAQLEYTDKMKTIQKLCAYYDIPVADTIAAFEQSGYAYEDLTVDGTHPNQIGAGIYFDVVSDIIRKEADKEISSAWTYDVKNAGYFPVEDFKRVDDYTWKVKCGPLKGRIGLYRYYAEGSHKIIVRLDDRQELVEESAWGYEFKQAHFYEMSSDTYEIQESITVVFDSKESADDFLGLLVTDVKK